MKRRKVAAITLMLVISFLAIPLSSPGDEDEGPFIFWNVGEIAGLDFVFSEPLPVELPGGMEFSIESVLIETSGIEVIIIQSSGEYLYLGKYKEGVFWIQTLEFGLIPMYMLSGSLIEVGTIEGPIPPEDPLNFDAPPDVSLHFKARAMNPLDESTFTFELIILEGVVIFAGVTG